MTKAVTNNSKKAPASGCKPNTRHGVAGRNLNFNVLHANPEFLRLFEENKTLKKLNKELRKANARNDALPAPGPDPVAPAPVIPAAAAPAAAVAAVAAPAPAPTAVLYVEEAPRAVGASAPAVTPGTGPRAAAIGNASFNTPTILNGRFD